MMYSMKTTPRLFSVFAACISLGFISQLPAQSVFDVSLDAGGNFNTAARWIVISGNATFPASGDNITIVGTDGTGNSTTASQVALTTSPTIQNLIYGTSSPETDITRTVIFRGSGSTAKSLTISGDLTKYDSGTLTFRNNITTSTSLLSLAIQGNVTLHAETLNFGFPAEQHLGLDSLSIAGTTLITGGTMNVLAGVTPSLGALEMSGGSLMLNDLGDEMTRTIHMRSLSGTGGTIGGSTTVSGSRVILAVTGTEPDTNTFAGTITNGNGSGSIAFQKDGNSVQVLTGANTYAGGTIVNSGTLLVANETGSGVGTGEVVVKNGAIFGGSGLVALGFDHSVTVEAGGKLTAGGSNTSLRLNGGATTGPTLVMEEGARFIFDLSGDADLIQFWNYGGSADFVLDQTVIDFTGVAAGVYTLFTFYSDNGVSLTPSGITSGLVLGSGLDGFDDAFLTYGTNAITLTVIPEPGTAGLLIGSLALMFVVWKGRRK